MNSLSGCSVRHSQSGQVSAVRVIRDRGETSVIRVRCDFAPTTLLATLARSIVEGNPFQQPLQTVTDEVPASADIAEPAIPSALVAQIGQCKTRMLKTTSDPKGPASIRFFSGRIFLRGDCIVVSDGKAYFSENSHIWQQPLSQQSDRMNPALEPPTISGETKHHGNFFAFVLDDLDGACLFLDANKNRLQLGSQQTLLHKPMLNLCGWQTRLDLVTPQLPLPGRISRARPRDAPSLEAKAELAALFLQIATSLDTLGSVSKVRSSYLQTGGDQLVAARTLLLLGGRCMFHSGTILVLSGLLHFAGSWFRVQSAYGGVGNQQDIHRIIGTSVYNRESRKNSTSDMVNKKASLGGFTSPIEGEMLLNNAWLYAQGGTVFMGDTALLTDAHWAPSLAMRSTPLEQQEKLLADLPTKIRRKVPCRLFLQSGRFCISDGSCSLRAVSGVAWLRGRKVQLGADPADQLTVRGALVFLPTDPNVWIEGRDLLYKDGLLYLDDLTPVLMGGTISVDTQEMKLSWLSGWSDDGIAADASTGASSSEESSDASSSIGDFDQDVAVKKPKSGLDQDWELLSDCLCLLEKGGVSLHILRARLNLRRDGASGQATETVLVDRGVAYFAGESTSPSRKFAAFPPPRITGWPLMHRPSESARQWATSVDRLADTATFEAAKLSLRRGELWLNDKVPLLKQCRLVLNYRTYELAKHELVMPDRLTKSEQKKQDAMEQMMQQHQQYYQQPQPQPQPPLPHQQQQQHPHQLHQPPHQLQQHPYQLPQQPHQLPQQPHQLHQQHFDRYSPTPAKQLSGDSTSLLSMDRRHLGGSTPSGHGFIGGYSVVPNSKQDALIFSLKARFPDDLHFLFESS